MGFSLRDRMHCAFARAQHRIVQHRRGFGAEAGLIATFLLRIVACVAAETGELSVMLRRLI